ncbi:uncharacterized protein A1O5_00689 [Cladophialophora psammophila CBS 110553]|uniref:Uncharacterized protein n=1 Tax=Cladophialophora psammophila CBS 110553 TaxID=1182543 RepID=W9XGV6_9EURO|nr:uncharacterized protein A1O5_00689 [Cladophialophora psammophila CBS 110553]EXJ76181.1 hypothetical protein A1O5_00689 [Cladophialophora psammophila CBS 110553]
MRRTKPTSDIRLRTSNGSTIQTRRATGFYLTFVKETTTLWHGSPKHYSSPRSENSILPSARAVTWLGGS